MPSSKNYELAELLLQHGARLDMQSKGSRHTPLHKAILHGEEEVAKLFLGHDNVPVNAIDNKKSTPLHYALRYENVSLDLAYRIVEKGGNLYGPLDDQSRSPLDYLEESHPHETLRFVGVAKQSSHNKKKSNLTPTKAKSPSSSTKKTKLSSSKGRSITSFSKSPHSANRENARSPCSSAHGGNDNEGDANVTPSKDAVINSRITTSPNIPQQLFSNAADVNTRGSRLSGSKRGRSNSQGEPSSGARRVRSGSAKTPPSSTKAKQTLLFDNSSGNISLTSIFGSSSSTRLEQNQIMFDDFNRKLEAKKAEDGQKELFKRVDKEVKKAQTQRQRLRSLASNKRKYKNKKTWHDSASESTEEDVYSPVEDSLDDEESVDEVIEQYIEVDDLESADTRNYSSKINKIVLDLEDNVYFRVQAICRNSSFGDVLFYKYFEVPQEVVEGKQEAVIPKSPNDFEYSFCEDMVAEGSWAKWI